MENKNNIEYVYERQDSVCRRIVKVSWVQFDFVVELRYVAPQRKRLRTKCVPWFILVLGGASEPDRRKASVDEM